jgi:hypothetical protein
MNKFFFLALFFLFAGHISAQKNPYVPPPVTQKFVIFYPAVKINKVKWKKYGNVYEAHFKQNKVQTAVPIDSTGNIRKTEIQVKMNQVPKAITDSIARHYPGWKKNEVMKSSASGLVTYEVELAKGREELLLLYSEKGVLLRKHGEEKEKK